MALCDGCRRDEHEKHSAKVHISWERKGHHGDNMMRVGDCTCVYCNHALSVYLDLDVKARVVETVVAPVAEAKVA